MSIGFELIVSLTSNATSAMLMKYRVSLVQLVSETLSPA